MAEIAPGGKFLLYEVSYYVTVGFGFKAVAACLKAGTQIHMVLDDPIVDDRYSPGAVDMWMRICRDNAAVRRPACVAEPLDGCWIVAPMSVDAADFFIDEKGIRGSKRQTPGVVTPVLERLQRHENSTADIGLLTDIAENPAHPIPSHAGMPATHR